MSIAYNIGTSGEEHSTFLKLINNSANDSQIRAAIMQWTKNKELIKRRTREANLFLDGVYSNNGTIELIHVDPVSHREIPRLSKTINCRFKFNKNV